MTVQTTPVLLWGVPWTHIWKYFAFLWKVKKMVTKKGDFFWETRHKYCPFVLKNVQLELSILARVCSMLELSSQLEFNWHYYTTEIPDHTVKKQNQLNSERQLEFQIIDLQLINQCIPDHTVNNTSSYPRTFQEKMFLTHV